MDHEMSLGMDDGWDVATCSCGWLSPPCPGAETAAEFWMDHHDAANGDPPPALPVAVCTCGHPWDRHTYNPGSGCDLCDCGEWARGKV